MHPTPTRFALAPEGEPVPHVLDIVRWSATEALVSLKNGRLVVVDLELGTEVRALRVPEIEWEMKPPPMPLHPTRVLALEAERVVLWGWEMIVALDRETGSVLWQGGDGDHSIDEDDGPFAQVAGAPRAVLPNGHILDTATGEWVSRELTKVLETGRYMLAVASHPRSGAVFSCSDGSVLYWDAARTSGLVTLAKLASPASAIACADSLAVCVCADGRVIGVPLDGGETIELSAPRANPSERAAGAVAIEPDGERVASALRLYDSRTYKERRCVLARERSGASLQAVAEEPPASPEDSLVAPLWLPDGRLALFSGDKLSLVEVSTRITTQVELGAVATAAFVHERSLFLGDRRGCIHRVDLGEAVRSG